MGNKKLGTIELFTHGLRVKAIDDRVKLACRRILNEWCVHSERKVENHRGEMVVEKFVAQMYGAAFKNQNDFWFHKGQLIEFKRELSALGATLDDFEIKIIPVHKPAKIDIKLKEGRVLRDYQGDAKAFTLKPVPEGDHFSKMIGMPTGTGKLQSNDTPVLTPSGWTTIGNLQVNDWIITVDGSCVRVKGVFPQGFKDTYQVNFSDGRSTNAGLEHLWTVRTAATPAGEWSVFNTETLLGFQLGNDIEIPLYSPKDSEDNEEFDVESIHSEEDFIDKACLVAYETAAISQRRRLARKLLELDGHVVGNSIVYYTESPVAADEFSNLIRSLGGTALCLESEDKRSWEVEICVPDAEGTLSENVKDDWRQRHPGQPFPYPRLYIDEIKFEEHVECTCISVDHPSQLYVCENYIVTHNTVTFCGTSVENAERTVIGVLPKYAKKWCLDLESNLDIKPKEIMLIEKTSQLRGTIDKCKRDGHKWLPPYIIVTLSTMRSFYDNYQDDPSGTVEDMGCEPWQVMGLLGAGLFGIDEAHEHINTVFLTAMYLHGVRFMALSGTMRTEDAFQEKVQNTIFPQIKRYLDIKMKKYIDVEFIGYAFDPAVVRSIRYQAFGRTDYSHAVFEKSIMKNPAVLRDYIKMNLDLLEFDYIQRRKGKRALIFVGTVELADKMITAMTMRFPFLNIARYCAAQGDKYDDLLSADVTVSTLQSSGTAVDIPMLIQVICTTVVNSSKSNIQALGRLRDLGEHEKVTMYMPYCKQNPKHLKYMAFRHELFRDITKSIKTFNYDSFIGRRL